MQKRRRVNGMVALRLLLLVGAATLAVGHDDLRRQLRKKRSLPCNPKKDTSCCLDRLRTKRCQKLVAKRPRKCGKASLPKRCRATCDSATLYTTCTATPGDRFAKFFDPSSAACACRGYEDGAKSGLTCRFVALRLDLTSD